MVNVDNVAPKVDVAWDEETELLHIAPVDASSTAEELLVEAVWADGSVTTFDPSAAIVLSSAAGALPTEIRVTDPAGNVTSRVIDARVHGFHENAPVGGGGGGGCNCSVVGGEDPAPLAPMFIVVLGRVRFGLIRRRRRGGSAPQAPRASGGSLGGSAMLLVASATIVIFGSGVVGCAGCCNKDPMGCEEECPEGGTYDEASGMCICDVTTCTVDQDCADVMCLSGFPYCNQETMLCDCYPLVPPAKPGRYSEIGVSGGTAYISAYSDSLGT